MVEEVLPSGFVLIPKTACISAAPTVRKVGNPYFGRCDANELVVRTIGCTSEEVVACIVLHYSPILSWCTAARVSKTFQEILKVPWEWVRAQPRDGKSMLNTKCTWCGWLTGRDYTDLQECVVCDNTAICCDCRRILLEQKICYRCVEPEDMPSGHLAILMLWNTFGDALDHLTASGKFFKINLEDWTTFQNVFRAWGGERSEANRV